MISNFFQNKKINNDIKKFLEENLSKKKDCKFGYFIINKRNLNEICIINNYPEWFDLYVECNHQMVDPVVIKSLSRVKCFSWDEDISTSSKLALPEVMQEAKKYCIDNGYTFILHDCKNNLALLSIFNNYLLESEKEILLNKEKLFFLLMEAHQRMLSEYDSRGGSDKVGSRGSICITKKENDILYWASIGKTYNEISIIAGIKDCTVKFHMGNIVKKLGAVNAKHAIRLASDLKLVVFPADKYEEIR